MLDWMMGAYSGIKAASDITQSMMTLKTDAAVTTKVIELNGVLMSLQGQLYAAHTEQTALTARISELEALVTRFHRWDEEKMRYRLHQFSQKTLAYALKAEFLEVEPEHYLCVNCYELGHKSILQTGNENFFHALKCNRCGAVIRTEAASIL